MMAAGDSRLRSHVIVVADPRSDFVTEMDRLAAEYDVSVTRCDDIYSATMELARHPGRFLLVAGMFRHLTRGKGDFFALAERDGVPCCCLLDAESDMERDKILAAVRLGARLAGEMADIRQVLEDRLAAEGRGVPGEREEDLLGEPFRATQEEINALLKRETDG